LLINKLREMAMAERIEAEYDKEEILTRYVNTVFFGDHAYGVEVASQRFFSQPAAQLRTEEAATLVGLLKAPTAYNPRRHPEAAQRRRNVVLDQMARYGYLPTGEADSLKALPLTLNYSYQNHHSGLAPYFRQHLRRDLLAWCRTHPRPDGTYYNLYTDGLKIYTTLHAGLQRYAEEAVAERMARVQATFDREWRGRNRDKATGSLVTQALRRSPRYQALLRAGHPQEAIDSLLRVPVPMRIFTWAGEKDTLLSPVDSLLHSAFTLHAGFLAMEPGSGHVRAWVGGINHAYYQYDHVTARRQTGSIFKPFVYAAALEEHLSPCTFIPNERVVFEAYDDWSPGNSDGEYGGEYTFEEALAQSVNVVAVNLIMEIGPERVAALAHRLGIEGELPAVPSLALGTGEASLLDMVQAYAAFANGGQRVHPLYLLRIEDAQGEILDDFTYEVPAEPVLRPETATILTHLLQSVVSSGTARGLRSAYGLKLDIAGKTGTSQNQADGWFVGNTPELIAGAWVGAEDQRVHFRSLRTGQGAATAMPIWAGFMQRVSRDPEFAYVQKAQFPPLSEALQDSLACATDVPLAESEFKVWYEQYQREQDSLARLEEKATQ
ncbi:MAG: penicillin-binding protein, partial [Bacteroidetes bacterium]